MESTAGQQLLVEKIPIAFSIIAMIVSVTFWATSASVKASDTADRMDKMDAALQKREEIQDKFEREVIERLARIEQALKQ